MGLITVGSGAPENEVEAGTYPATIANVGVKNIDVKNPQFGEAGPRDFYEWKVAIDGTEDDEGIPLYVEGLTSMATGPKSNTFKYLTAILGAIAVGQDFEESDLVGKHVMAVVDLNKDGFSRLVDLVAAPKAAPAARRANPARPTVAASVATEDELPF